MTDIVDPSDASQPDVIEEDIRLQMPKILEILLYAVGIPSPKRLELRIRR